MDASILTTKLYIPPARSSWVIRPQLIDRINQNPGVCLISAPAGFGKTTLLASWVQQSPHHIAWLSLEEADNDVVRFLEYIVAAVQSLHDTFGEATQLLLANASPDEVVVVLTTLINEIAALEGQYILVLDDYHCIDDAQVHECLTFLIEHQPPQLQLIISTREDPPLPLSKLRASGLLSQVRATDLRFSFEETQDFFHKTMHLRLDSTALQQLDEQTEGWVAGLQLAALSLQEHPDRAQYIASIVSTDRYILDYLGDEVFAQQPTDVQAFLLDTAILERMYAPLCNVVATRNDSSAMLSLLQDANLFLIPLDHQQQWFRYHHLFRDLLRFRLARTAPERVATLHRRAAEWLYEQQLFDEAMQHIMAIPDYEWAADVLHTVGQTVLWKQGRVATLRTWLASMPPHYIDNNVRLSTLSIWLNFMAGELDQLEERVAALLSLQHNSTTTRDDVLMGEVLALEAIVRQIKGDFVGTIQLVEQALELLPAENSYVRGILTSARVGAYFVTRDLDSAEAALEASLPNDWESGNTIVAIKNMFTLTQIHVARGQLFRALGVAEKTRTEAQFYRQLQNPLISVADLALGMLYYEMNRLHEAIDVLERGLANGERVSNEWLTMLFYSIVSRAWQAVGKGDEALAMLDDSLRIARKYQTPNLAALTLVEAYRIRLLLRQGKYKDTLTWAKNLAPLHDYSLNLQYDFEYFTQVRAWLANGHDSEAEALIHMLHERADQEKRYGHRMEAQMLLALLHYARGNIGESLKTIEPTLNFGAERGYFRLFVDEGAPMAQLLYKAVENNIQSEYVGQLLAAFPAPEAAQALKDPISNAIIEPLSHREREVLTLIAEGLSNREIAQHLYLAPGTVKVHTRNIYSKLSVSSRTQAVKQARQLGIL